MDERRITRTVEGTWDRIRNERQEKGKYEICGKKREKETEREGD